MDYCLRNAIYGREEEPGFTTLPRQTRRIGLRMITDLDFCDDIGLISNTTEQALTELEGFEKAALNVELHRSPTEVDLVSE